ncbi:hypothetical protein BJX63DRAFT_423096 [Aspergillus granulosus]|uniref:Uncharacterized protein n=1 Tax=Aspergillus granulosus TaxID=176169 RepID=A0ABR4H4K6_9EURO
MPPSRTPAHATPRQNARPQFASTPRFFLSQRSVGQHKRAENRDLILSEDDADSIHLIPTQTAPRGPTSRKDVIEDINSELGQEQDAYEQPVNSTQAANLPSSPSVDVAELDAEIDELFGPTRSRAKRRRISVDLEAPIIQTQTRKPRDLIQSSSPGPSFSAAEPPSPSLPYRTTPIPPRNPATPATAKPSARSFPRFLVPSVLNPPLSTQSQPRVRPLAATPGPTARKPTFVLPRSPSPEQEDPNGIPTPFSPSSRALRRKRCQRSSAPNYLSGGMAAEVRSWILEMGTKREHRIQAVRDARNGGDPSSVDLQSYSLVVRITSLHRSALGSCGPLTFIQGQEVLALQQMETVDGRDTPQRIRNVLLLGAPRTGPDQLHTSASTSGSGPRVGDVVGVHRGLVWEIDMETDTTAMPEQEQILRRESDRAPVSGRWLVGMEWEVISSSS